MIKDKQEPERVATLNDVLEVLEQNHEILEDIRTWMRIEGVGKVQGILSKALDTAEKIRVYNLSDGKTTREIGAICNLDPKTISNYWRSWYRLGLMKAEMVRGGGSRYSKAFEPEDYGIKVPQTPKQNNVQTSQTTSPTVEQPKTEVDTNAN